VPLGTAPSGHTIDSSSAVRVTEVNIPPLTAHAGTFSPGANRQTDSLSFNRSRLRCQSLAGVGDGEGLLIMRAVREPFWCLRDTITTVYLIKPLRNSVPVPLRGVVCPPLRPFCLNVVTLRAVGPPRTAAHHDRAQAGRQGRSLTPHWGVEIPRRNARYAYFRAAPHRPGARRKLESSALA
jgi:hypothetical protein